jgi:hypothetical protein
MASQDDIANHLLISQQLVSKLVRKKVFPAADRGDYDIDACRVAYFRYLRGQIRDRLIDSFDRQQRAWALECGFFTEDEIDEERHQ